MEIEMNALKKLLKWVNKNVLLAEKVQWVWVGDDSNALFERRFTHAEFDVIARVGVDRDANRSAHFSDTWVPGAVELPSHWKERIGEDVQWYVPRNVFRFGLKTGSGVFERIASVKQLFKELSADAEVFVGERTLYRVEIDVEYHGIHLASDVRREQDVVFLPLDMDPIDQIVASMLPDAVAAARMHCTYRSVAFSAA